MSEENTTLRDRLEDILESIVSVINDDLKPLKDAIEDMLANNISGGRIVRDERQQQV